MRSFLEYLVKNIVDDPEAVEVEQADLDGLIELKIKVASADMGKVIGRGGRIIKGIRDLVRVLATKENVRVNVSLVE